MTYIICGIITISSIIGIIYCLNKLNKKQIIDNKELEKYNSLLDEKKQDYLKLDLQCGDMLDIMRSAEERANNAQEKYESLIKKYKEESQKNQEDLNTFFNKETERRQQELDERFLKLEEEKYKTFNLKAQEIENDFNKFQQEKLQEVEEANERAKNTILNIDQETELLQEKYNNLLAPLKQYEKDKQDKLFYTIQVPDEYKEDIEYLLTQVSPKIQHPDIINKLIWTEYIKPYIDDTFKRVGIKDEPGIYKLTNIENGKSYIGKSTNIKKRISDHIKSAIGITTIADQWVHHAILQTGFWNWLIEPIIYCDKDKLNEMEKYYIEFFQTQEFGYNRKEGG